MCGGTAPIFRVLPLPLGLSPRVRGNQTELAVNVVCRGSIPACAGEPPGRRRDWLSPGVYPRVCGGTRLTARTRPSRLGLSPRVRGNHTVPHYGRTNRRSIPACAGEPASGRVDRGRPAVYPRVCGGTGQLVSLPAQPLGLSPRVRGNHLVVREDDVAHRSIPACAGEPVDSARPRSPQGVYPRVCGGTFNQDVHSRKTRGLSPRVRGNPGSRPPSRLCRRSIPACAGEPDCMSRARTAYRVYPRVCGGTATKVIYPSC